MYNNAMPISSVIGVVMGIILLIPALLSQVALWQRKEYRLDRMWAHLSTPASGLPKHHYLLGSMALIAAGWVAYIASPTSTAVNAIAWLALAGYVAHHGTRLKRIGLVRPDMTLKSITAGIAAALIISAFFKWVFVSDEVPLLQIATLNFLLPGIVAAALPFVNFMFYLRKRQVASLAREHRQAFPTLPVVGITGSYGKTSAKYFLQQLLAASGKTVAATKEHCNSYYCVAQDLLRHVTADTDTYIAEMGAYRRGEIQQIADIVQPTVGVITIIGNQHLHLFGSQQKILDTKWELATSLPPGGTLVINNDDPLSVERAKTFTGNVITFSTQEPADIWVEMKAIGATTITAILHINAQSAEVTIPLASPALVSSLAAAMAAAHALNTPMSALVSQLPTIKPFPRTMEIRVGRHGATIIDDSYSAGELPVKNAIQHLSRFSSPDKRIVMVPLIELGPDAPGVHRAIGELIRDSGGRAYIFGEQYKKEIASEAGQANIKWYTDPAAFIRDITQGLSSASVVLLEGRILESARKRLIS